ncbi:class I tRNA ligase family protein [Patescibacteria group bacterium]|nr:class I tRNA ligase family protein [Patescibacteria group bacterium]
MPIVLPDKVKFGKGNPLETNKAFVSVKCPICRGNAKRETDTMDTFFDSSWYYLRYSDNKNRNLAFDKKKVEYWLPVDQYIGGAEHACMHLIYARFFTKALRDLGFLKFDEPFLKLFNQGMLHGPDGEKMSKSKGNIINPDEVSEKYGMDSARFFLLALALPDKSRDWSEEGIQGSSKFLKKILDYFNNVKIGKSNVKIESKLNKIIKEVTTQIENFKYNLAIIKIRDLFNSLSSEESKDVLEKSLKLLHPFCPHITEELWEKIKGKGFISLSRWPEADEKKIDENLDKQEELIKKLKSDIEKIKKLTGHHRRTPRARNALQGAKKNPKIYVYVLPNELKTYQEVEEINLYAVNDKNKYDPENKSKKVKPNRPGIYLE